MQLVTEDQSNVNISLILETVALQLTEFLPFSPIPKSNVREGNTQCSFFNIFQGVLLIFHVAFPYISATVDYVAAM